MECTRRGFFGELGRKLATDLANTIDSFRAARASSTSTTEVEPPSRKWVRPPGALPESKFLSTCTRCTTCQEACPYQSIRRLGPEFGDRAGTPAIIPDESPCYLCEDMPCITACEPRALVSLPRSAVRMGLAVISPSACYAAQQQPCDYCVVRCPLKSESIGFDEQGIPRVNETGCTGCGVCAYLCPARAIAILPTAFDANEVRISERPAAMANSQRHSEISMSSSNR